MTKKMKMKLFQSQTSGILFLMAMIIGLLLLVSFLISDPFSYMIGVVGGVLLGELLVLKRVQNQGVVLV